MRCYWLGFDGKEADIMTEKQFLKISSLTPLVNVDLFVMNENREILLAWRDDIYCGTGWHIPGGIIRNGETREHRLQETAKQELGFIPTYEIEPLAVNEIILKQKARNHFISFLYGCHVEKEKIQIAHGTIMSVGTLMWFSKCPEHLVYSQEIYREYIERYFRGKRTSE